MAGDPLKKGRYTEYSNKIGLFDKSEKQFIGNSPEVVLSFPFKDAVLEASMTKEDAGREERFLNIKMDAKDIDTLEDPKVLTNFKYVDKDGEKELDENSDIEFFDENGELKQNLLIKGNNLLALHTLKEKLAGQIKLIYIDPPYNTGSDGFKYNDNFNHSAWLTFMKNRLEVAKSLLKKDGLICISCDDNEQAYLKVMMDEIFGRENFISNIVNQSANSVFGTKASAKDRTVIKVKDYVLMYKNGGDITLNPLYTKSETPIFNTHEFILDDNGNKITVTEWFKNEYGDFLKERKIALDKNAIINYLKIDDFFRREVTEKLRFIMYRTVMCNKDLPKDIEDKLRQGRIVEHEGWKYMREGNGRGGLCTLRCLNDSCAMSDDRSPEFTKCDILGDIWNTSSSYQNINVEGATIFKNGKKPEELIYKILKLTTNEGDLVLDYHLGSGTTAAVAHKMNRRWIGVEQMDYIDTLAKKRIKSVINGETSGISSCVGWSGGGSFVYCELKKYNQDFIDRIMEAITIPELEEIYEDMQKNAFLKFFFDKNEFEKDENFRSKSLDERKELLVGILDENQFYLNLSEMNDTKYKVTDAERVLTEKFYQIKEDEVEDAEE